MVDCPHERVDSERTEQSSVSSSTPNVTWAIVRNMRAAMGTAGDTTQTQQGY